MTVTAYIGLGSNLAGDLPSPAAQVLAAFDDIASIETCNLTRRSSLYRSTAMTTAAVGEQPDYINAAVEIETALGAHDLLAELQAIEDRHGRVREQRWGPRTLDLDILLYAGEIIDTDDLVIPHPGLPGREFVVLPLLEIAASLVVPGHGKLSDIAVSVRTDGLVKIGDVA